jgi:hypothetical protein
LEEWRKWVAPFVVNTPVKNTQNLKPPETLLIPKSEKKTNLKKRTNCKCKFED